MKGGYQILDFGGSLTVMNANLYRQPQSTPGMFDKADEAIKSGKMILLTGFKDIDGTFPGAFVGSGTDNGHKYINLMYFLYHVQITDNGYSTIYRQA